MMGEIRRKLKSIDDDALWDADMILQPEVEATTDLPTDSQDMPSASRVTGEFRPNTGMSDYYAGVVRAAIAQGGRYGDHQISLPWLRKILAGLEWRNVEPETLWEGVDGLGPSVPNAKIPVYDELFPSGPEPSPD
ncbi:MAG TPA: hypothetical protein VGR53_06045 [Nitrososphaerales archaeon]|nr:hypothetical protein [Nitrososphaerales archaeon]